MRATRRGLEHPSSRRFAVPTEGCDESAPFFFWLCLAVRWKGHMANGEHDLDEIDERTVKTAYLQRLFPADELKKALVEKHYTEVEVVCDTNEGNFFEVKMRSGDEAVNSYFVRQQLYEIIQQLPEALPHHLKWRVNCAVALVTGQQIAAAIKVSPVQMATKPPHNNDGLLKG